jgi:hypothetical protein
VDFQRLFLLPSFTAVLAAVLLLLFFHPPSSATTDEGKPKPLPH